MNAIRSKFRFLGPLSRVSNLDAVFFWSVYCLSAILILWLFCTFVRTQLIGSLQQQIISLVQTTSAFIHHEPLVGTKNFAYLDVVQKENPFLTTILVTQMENNTLRILHQSGDIPAHEPSELKASIEKASAQNGTTLSAWQFLQPAWNPFITEGDPGIEWVCHSLATGTPENRHSLPVLVMMFDTSSMVEKFKTIDRHGSVVVSLAVLIGTVLAFGVRWRGIQRENAIAERLGALDLLRQRDMILAMVAGAADDLLRGKETKPAIQKLMDGFCQFLKLKAAYAVLKPPAEPGEVDSNPPLSLGTKPVNIRGLTLETLCSEEWQDVHAELLRGNYHVVRGGRLEAPAPGNPAESTDFLVLFPILINRRLAGFMALYGGHGAELPESGVLDCLRLASDLIQSACEKQESEKKLLHGNKMLALGRMAGGVAHEFNNLLHIISGNLRRLLARADGASANADNGIVEKILLASDRGARIVQQLLSATRQAPPTFTAASLNGLVERTLSLGQSAFRKNIELKTRLDPRIPPLPMDEGQIQQVLLNLLINAEYAIKGSGILTLTTGLTAPDREDGKGRYAYCEVRDSGSGIEPEALQHMFDPFFTTKPPGSGTGLGLSTSRGIMESHGGTLEGRNHPSGGAFFTFYLPLENQEPLQAVEEFAPTALGQEIRGQVWIADDEPLCREFLLEFLVEQNLKVLDFPSGDALLRYARESGQKPQWIVTDWSMPGISGQSLVKELRRLLPSTPLIVTSGFALEPAETEEVNAIMQKPFAPAEIIKLMASLRQDSGDPTAAGTS